MGFPAPPKPHKAPPWCPLGLPPPPIPNFATEFASGFFTSSATCPLTGGSITRDRGNRTIKPGSPCPRPGTPSAASDQSGNKRGSGTRETPARVLRHFPKASNRRTRGTVPAQQTDLHATGLSGGGCQQPPRTGLRYFISSFRKTCQKQLCLTAMCSFFLPFFFS